MRDFIYLISVRCGYYIVEIYIHLILTVLWFNSLILVEVISPVG